MPNVDMPLAVQCPTAPYLNLIFLQIKSLCMHVTKSSMPTGGMLTARAVPPTESTEPKEICPRRDSNPSHCRERAV